MARSQPQALNNLVPQTLGRTRFDFATFLLQSEERSLAQGAASVKKGSFRTFAARGSNVRSGPKISAAEQSCDVRFVCLTLKTRLSASDPNIDLRNSLFSHSRLCARAAPHSASPNHSFNLKIPHHTLRFSARSPATTIRIMPVTEAQSGARPKIRMSQTATKTR